GLTATGSDHDPPSPLRQLARNRAPSPAAVCRAALQIQPVKGTHAMSNAKYEFVPGDTKIINGRTLKRIRALVAIAALGVRIGDLGGYIESETNLQVYGNAWVYLDARVYGDPRFYGGVWVYGGAWVYGNARVYGKCEKSPICVSGLTWHVTITDEQMSIGCQSHTLKASNRFTAKKIEAMDSQATEFGAAHKTLITGLARAAGRLEG